MEKPVFTLKLPMTGEIKLTWGIWAMKLFCDRKGVAVDDFFEVINAFVSPEGIDKKEAYSLTINFLTSAYEAQNDRCPSEKEVCGWLDELGGITGMAANLAEFFNWIISLTLTNTTPLPGETAEPEKKNE